MDIFATVKAAVTVRQAAEHYGLQVSRNGMTCCPFHDDRHPSMKLYLYHVVQRQRLQAALRADGEHDPQKARG